MIKILEKWANHLFPHERSLVGKGSLKTLKFIKNNINKNFKIEKIKSGSQSFSWTIPKEFLPSYGVLKDEDGKVICDFKKNSLHIMKGSVSVNKWLNYNDLKKHIFVSKRVPSAIPFVSSYYKKNWGFCLSNKTFLKLDNKKKYHAEIKSNFFSGNMYYSEMLIKGKSKKEILICSYICHPSLANDNLSGILAISMLSKLLKKSKYSIRLLLIPETLGAVHYIKKNINLLKSDLVAGFNLTCVGIDGPITLVSSLSEDTYADNVCKREGSKYSNFRKISFKKRGSNERQFGCQNLKLPFVSICRKKLGEYKEYHTSADNLKILNYKVIMETVKFIEKIVNTINNNKIYRKKSYCEPFLANTNLIDNISTEKSMKTNHRRNISDILAYIDKNHDLKSLEKKIKIKNINSLVAILEKNKLVYEWI